jgi:hypothetical protein
MVLIVASTKGQLPASVSLFIFFIFDQQARLLGRIIQSKIPSK